MHILTTHVRTISRGRGHCDWHAVWSIRQLAYFTPVRCCWASFTGMSAISRCLTILPSLWRDWRLLPILQLLQQTDCDSSPLLSCKMALFQQQHTKLPCTHDNHGPYPRLYATLVLLLIARWFFTSFSAGLNLGSNCSVHVVRGRAKWILWVEQFWNVHLRKLDREIFADCPFMKIGSLENFQLQWNL